MAEITNTTVIGAHTSRMTPAQKATIGNYDRALGGVGLQHLLDVPASFFAIDLYVHTDANNNTKASCKIKAPRPLTIWAADVGCESAAGTTGTVDILVDDVSILNAAEDVKAAAGTCSRVAPEVDSENVAYNSTIHCTQTSGSAAAMVGGQAHLYVQLQ